MYFKLYKQIRNRVKILKKEKIKILLFLIKEDKSLLKMLFDWDIYKLYMRDDLLNRFLNNLAKFINNIDIKQIEKKDLIKILNISVNMLLTYYKFLHFNKILTKAIYKSKREKFLLSSVRILEFAIFLAFKKDKKVKEIFLDNYDVDSSKQYFFYLKDLNETLKINYFAIYKSKQTKKNKIVVGFNKEDCKKANKDEELKKKIIDNSFKSFIRTQSFEKIDINDFDHYFHLQDDMVDDFYNYEKAKFVSGSSVKGRSREIDRKEFITIEKDKIEYVSFINNKNIEDLTDEVKTEIKTKANSTVSPVLDKKAAILIESDILVNKPSKVEINSKFKRYMIAKAISNSIAKNNLNISKYQIPEIEHLKDFFAFLYERDKLKSDLILLQIIFNSNLEKLITGFINKNIIFRHERFYMEYGNFFSNLKNKVNIFKKIKPEKKFYIYITEIIRLILEDFQNHIVSKIDTENLKEDINNLENKLSNFLKKSRNEFNKKIVLNMKTLPELSFYYFKSLKKTPSINMLFAKDIAKNDEARLCYCATTQRLKSYESWILELIDMLEISKVRLKENISNIIPTEFKSEDKIGSYKVLKRGSFKNFLLNLEQLFYENDLTKEDKINIQMIYLRYVLGLLLATRDFDNSCDLSNYSKKFKILILQEKAKSIYMSKRIIPLTKEAMEYIEIFQKIKQKNNIKSNSPVLLIDNKEVLITKSEMKKFFFKLEKYDYLKYILYFIEHCRLNFGRHIATYYFANDDNVKEEYLDAFLGHFKMGSEDQGIFSYFNNKEYIDIIISKIEEIEQDYLRTSIIFKEIS